MKILPQKLKCLTDISGWNTNMFRHVKSQTMLSVEAIWGFILENERVNQQWGRTGIEKIDQTKERRWRDHAWW